MEVKWDVVITIPREQVPDILAGLQHNDPGIVAHFVHIIQQELDDRDRVDQALEQGDLKVMEQLAREVGSGFNRFRLLTAIMDLEQKGTQQ